MVAADRESEYDIFEPDPDGIRRESDDEEEEDEAKHASRWKMFHKTRHELRLRVTPRVDKDFVAKFAFEKIDCKSTFEVFCAEWLWRKGARAVELKKTFLTIVRNNLRWHDFHDKFFYSSPPPLPRVDGE